ncbi:MAG: hypothetical protein ACYTGG_09515 [Planctomycetota bacterium]|jgi:hypothetical protein
MSRVPRFQSGLAIIAVVVFVGVGILFPTPGAAQSRGFRGQWGGGRVEMYYQRRDLPLMVDYLDLDSSQKTIIEVLLLDAVESFEAVSEVMRARADELRAQRTPEQEEERQAQRERMRGSFAEMRELRQTLGELEGESGRTVSPEIIAKLEDRLAELQGELETSFQERFQSDEFRQMQEAQERIRRDWRAERDRIQTKFVADIHGILTPKQYERWPGLERQLRRVKTMSRGRLSGENIDLFILLRDAGIKLNEYPDLPELLDAYASELDQALLARNRHLDASSDAMGRAFREQEFDLIADLASKEANLRVRVRSVNEQGAMTIAAALDEDGPGGEFARAFREKAFSRVYRRTSMQRAFDVVRKFEGLDPELVEALRALEEAYLMELGERNEQIIRVTRREEPKQMVDRVGRMRRGFGRNRDEESPDPLRAAYVERDEMDQRYRRQLESLLTKEQIAMLPEMRAPGRTGRRGGFNDRLAELDANGDGKLQRSEVPERMQGFFNRLDANGDGAVDEQEMQNFGGRRGGGPGGRGGRDGGGRPGGGRGG